MRKKQKRSTAVTVLLALAVCFSSASIAHLMQDQHGTINIIDDTAFLVLSVPITAFCGMDNDRNGKVSMIEFNKHRADIVSDIRQKLVMSDSNSEYLLQGILLSPAVSDTSTSTLAPHITVMGRFVLPEDRSGLHIRLGLFGEKKSEQTFEVAVKDKRRHQSAKITFTREADYSTIF